MQKYLKLLTASLVVAHTLVTPQVSHGMELSQGPQAFEPPKSIVNYKIPKPVMAMIFEYAARDTNPGKLRLVCKNWKGIIDANSDKDTKIDDKGIRYTTIGHVWKRCVNAWYGMTGENKAIYEMFLNGKLIYRPTEGSDEGMIEFKISDLKNPFEGTFDLSECGKAGQSLSISTGYRKRKNPKNETKLEIWISPRSLMDKTGRFQDILKNGSEELAPIVLLWTWGGWDDLKCCDYLSDKSLDDISNNNIYENWITSIPSSVAAVLPVRHNEWMTYRSFHVHFMSQNKDY